MRIIRVDNVHLFGSGIVKKIIWFYQYSGLVADIANDYQWYPIPNTCVVFMIRSIYNQLQAASVHVFKMVGKEFISTLNKNGSKMFPEVLLCLYM